MVFQDVRWRIKMDKNEYTRRDVIKGMSLVTAALSMPGCRFAAEKTGEKPFKFVHLCDPQLGFGGYEHDVKTFKQAVKQVNAMKPDFVVICGDLVDIPDERSFADFITIKAEFTVPCYCAPGNHDAGSKPTQKSLQYYRKVVGKDYYSFEHEGCVFVIVNTELWKNPLEHESKKQDSWLETTLETAAKKGSRVFVIGHHPLFLKKADENELYYNLPVAKRRELLTLFEKQGVVAVLGGHTHKLLVNEYKGIQLVNGETTSKNFDKRPFGFRLWHIGDTRPFMHDFVPLEVL